MNVGLYDFFLILIGLGLGLFALVYWGGSFWDWIYLRKWKNKRKICRLCGMRFYGDEKASVQKCPHCHALTK